MSGDRYEEVTNESWFSRLGGSLKGIVAGLVIFILAVPLLYWNEGRAVKTQRTLEEGGGSVVTVASGRVDAVNDGKLVHVTGTADTGPSLTDTVFGVSVVALKLDRTVEMFQWQETLESTTDKKLGGGTETTRTYSYSRKWSDRLVDSARFRQPEEHQNPAAMPFQSTRQVATEVKLGAFALPPSLVDKMHSFEPFPVSGETALPANLEGTVRLHDGGYYVGSDPMSPGIGDVRIRFRVVMPAQVSIIARQSGNTLKPYRAAAGGIIEMLQPGKRSADAMIQSAQQGNTWLTWMPRLAGFFVMSVGINLVLRPLSVLADVVPMIGNIAGTGTGFVASLLAGIFSLITIAIAWLASRPLLAAGLLAVAAGHAVAIWRWRTPRRNAPASVR